MADESDLNSRILNPTHLMRDFGYDGKHKVFETYESDKSSLCLAGG